MFIVDEQLSKLNLGTIEEHHIVLVNVVRPEQFQLKVQQLLMEFKDVFAWSYKELEGIHKSTKLS